MDRETMKAQGFNNKEIEEYFELRQRLNNEIITKREAESYFEKAKSILEKRLKMSDKNE